MDICVSVSVKNSANQIINIHKSLDKSDQLQSLVTTLRAVQSETNSKLTELINQSNGNQDTCEDKESEEEEEDDSDDLAEPAEKIQKTQ